MRMTAIMPEKQIDLIQVFFYLVAAVSGMVGGCAMAAQEVIRRRSLGALPFMAYALVGLFFGLAFFAFLDFKDFIEPTMETAVLYGGGGGLFATFALVGMNVGSNWVLKWRGLEVNVTFQQKPKNGKEIP